MQKAKQCSQKQKETKSTNKLYLASDLDAQTTRLLMTDARSDRMELLAEPNLKLLKPE